MTPLTIECEVHFDRKGRGSRKVLEAGPSPRPVEPGRVPRVSRLMALAIRCDALIRDGVIENMQYQLQPGISIRHPQVGERTIFPSSLATAASCCLIGMKRALSASYAAAFSSGMTTWPRIRESGRLCTDRFR